MTSIRTAAITGFFSLPSPSLAEHNPSAYNNMMASAPAGAGTCSQCGMGILHHVVIRDEAGETRFIGTDCALKVGCKPDQIRERLTDEQRVARDARREAAISEWQRNEQARKEAESIRLAARREKVGDLVDMLRGIGGDFYGSLASQLECGPLSWRQANYVAKATSETGRRNKRNADSWDSILEDCTAEEAPPA